MAQKLEQTQTQAQLQQLSTLQVALAGLVELPLADLAERVQNEMMDNAALEESAAERDGDDENESRQENGDDSGTETETEGQGGEIGDSLGDYMSEDDVPAYLQERADEARWRNEMPLTGGTSAYDDLVRQMGEHDLNAHEREVMDYLIGSLDDDGFLRKDLETMADEMAIYHNVMTSVGELERLLNVLHTFEPRGIGARSLQECLRLQLSDPDLQSPYKALAIKVLDRCFKDFTAKRWDAVCRTLNIDEETLGHVRHVLTHLNPLPGSALGSGQSAEAPTALPDFFVTVGTDGLPLVELNQGDVPELRVSRAFRDSISQYAARRGSLTRHQREAYVYARQKVEAAQAFIGLIARRQHTLMAVMQAIVDLQEPFFTENDDEALLRPLVLKDVAARAGVDISTVSRVTGSKYVQTDYGLYPLKFFFSSQFTSESGDEVSTRQVRATLRDIIEAEDKKRPLSDEAITARLREQGLPVARRTVAKYREQMGILAARLRKN